MADLFQTTVPNINLHLKNVYEERELDEFWTIKDFLIVQNEGKLLPEATIRKFRIVQKEGKREVSRSVDFYNNEDENKFKQSLYEVVEN
jgi:hypothetical protein